MLIGVNFGGAASGHANGVFIQQHVNCWACDSSSSLSSVSLKTISTAPPSDNHLHGKQHSSNNLHLDMLTMSGPLIKLSRKTEHTRIAKLFSG